MLYQIVFDYFYKKKQKIIFQSFLFKKILLILNEVELFLYNFKKNKFVYI